MLQPKTTEEILQDFREQMQKAFEGVVPATAKDIADVFEQQLIEFNNHQHNLMGWFPITVTLDDIHDGGCKHDMKDYVGFTQAYRYCTKCDHKEIKQ